MEVHYVFVIYSLKRRGRPYQQAGNVSECKICTGVDGNGNRTTTPVLMYRDSENGVFSFVNINLFGFFNPISIL